MRPCVYVLSALRVLAWATYVVPMEIADSARKHGLSDADIAHAVRYPLRVLGQDGQRYLVIGADRAGRLLEVVVLDDDPNEEPVAIHAMVLRAKFYDQL